MSHVVCGQEERWRSRSPPQPRRQSRLPPSRIHPQHVWWELNTGGCAGGSPVTGRCKILSVICDVHSGARSREGVARRPLLSIPRSQELTVEPHLDGRGQEQPGTRTQHRTEGQLADLPICFRV